MEKINFKKLRLSHWTDEEFVEKTINGEGMWREGEGSLKPRGFWLSVDNSWEDWLKDNWDSWLDGKVCLSAEIDDDINLFIIDSKDTFLRKYKELVGSDYGELNVVDRFNMKRFHLRLKEKYDGMILLEEPFLEHRLDMDFMYFYSFDCESICIWNKKKIKFSKMEDTK